MYVVSGENDDSNNIYLLPCQRRMVPKFPPKKKRKGRWRRAYSLHGDPLVALPACASDGFSLPRVFYVVVRALDRVMMNYF